MPTGPPSARAVFVAIVAFLASVPPGVAHPTDWYPSMDVCKLVSLKAAQDIVGARVTSAAGDADNDSASCLYRLGPLGPVVTVSLVRTTLAAIRTEEADLAETPAPSLGPHAFWSARLRTLHVLAPSGEIIRVSVARHEGRWSDSRLKGLATAFAARVLESLNVS